MPLLLERPPVDPLLLEDESVGDDLSFAIVEGAAKGQEALWIALLLIAAIASSADLDMVPPSSISVS